MPPVLFGVESAWAASTTLQCVVVNPAWPVGCAVMARGRAQPVSQIRRGRLTPVVSTEDGRQKTSPAASARTKSWIGRISMPSAVRRARGSLQTTMRRQTSG